MSTLKADAVTTKSDNTDLTITGGGTGVPNLESGFKVGGTVEKLTGIAPSTSGNVLTSDGTNWTSAAAAAGAWSSVAAGTLSGSSGLNVTGITGTTIFFLNMIADTKFGSVCMRTSSNGGSSYESGSSDYYRNNIDIKQGESGYVFNSGNLNRILLSGARGSAETKYISIKGTLIRPQDAQETVVLTEYGGWCDTGSGDTEYRGTSLGMRNSAADVDAFQIIPESATLTGTYEIFQL